LIPGERERERGAAPASSPCSPSRSRNEREREGGREGFSAKFWEGKGKLERGVDECGMKIEPSEVESGRGI